MFASWTKVANLKKKITSGVGLRLKKEGTKKQRNKEQARRSKKQNLAKPHLAPYPTFYNLINYPIIFPGNLLFFKLQYMLIILVYILYILHDN